MIPVNRPTENTMCKANWLLLVVVAVLAISSLLSGCGKTGDLYLPEETPSAQSGDTHEAPSDAAPTAPGNGY